MYITNNKGPSVLPCGTPLVTFTTDYRVPSTQTCCVRLDRNDCIHLSTGPSISCAVNLCISLQWHT